jgi:hypothetical protein
MTTCKLVALVLPLVLVAAVSAGCGSSNRNAATPTTTAAPSTATTTTAAAAPVGALQAESTAKAAGDIPDNQVFLSFRNGVAGYSMKYPEGWAQQGTGPQVTFRDKNNVVRVVTMAAPRPTAAVVAGDVTRLNGARVQGAPQPMTLGGKPAFKVTYTTESPPNPVTGKRVKLVVDRYYLCQNGRRAIVDLGTPEGVDNVDAYRLMIESFRWR